MLQTYEAVLEKDHVSWIGEVPNLQSAHVWITILPQRIHNVEHQARSMPDFIDKLTRNPIKIAANTLFMSREQANAR